MAPRRASPKPGSRLRSASPKPGSQPGNTVDAAPSLDPTAFDAVSLDSAERCEWLLHIREVRELPARPECEREDPTPLAAGLWLAGAAYAKDPDELACRGITAIVNVAGSEFADLRPEYPSGWDYLEIDVLDCAGVHLLRDHFARIYPFMRHCVGRRQQILVHCMMGMNRSATVCVAFLMCHLGWHLPKALHHVVSRRPCSVANVTFQEDLIVLAKLSKFLARDPEVDDAIRWEHDRWMDKNFVLEAVSRDGCQLEYAAEPLRGDKDIVMAAVTHDGWALEYATEPLRGDKDVVLRAVTQEGLALVYAAEPLRSEREVVLAAVRQDGSALRYAAGPLQADPEVVSAAAA